MLLPTLRYLCVAAMLCLFIRAASAERPWLEIQSPHFRVLTDGTEADGKKVANEFEQMRHVFVVLLKSEDIGAAAPLTVFATHDVESFRQLEPGTWKATHGMVAGNFLKGWEHQYAVVRLDTWKDNNEIVVYHEYTHSVLHAREHWLPIWLDEGLAEFYGYTRFEASRIVVGAPSARSSVLRSATLLPATRMLDITSSAPIYHDDEKMQLFYAQSWAMVHYILFGSGKFDSSKMNAYLDGLEAGMPQDKLFEQVFGSSKKFDEGLDAYLRKMTLKAGVLPADQGIDPKTFATRKLNAAEVAYEVGCLQVGAHDYARAEQFLQRSLVLDPALAGAHEELGFLRFDAGKDAEAKAEWATALKLDPHRARALFAMTMIEKPLQAETKSAMQARQITLRQITVAQPGFAAPYAELALLDWQLGTMQQAYKDATQAEKLEPGRAGYHLLTGHILLRGHQESIAADYARYVAAHWYGPDHNEALELLSAVPVVYQGTGTLPMLDMPEGTDVVEGRLIEVSCGAAPQGGLSVTLQPYGDATAQPVTFKSNGRHMVGFSDTFWWGEDHFSVCHHLSGHRGVLAHKGEQIMDLEIRDELPDTREDAVQRPISKTLAALP